MIIGIGSDLVDINRIAAVYQKHGQRFIKRILTPNEIEVAHQRKQNKGQDEFLAYLAKRWAAKEACAKAMGTGLVTQGITFQDFETSHSAKGQPKMKVMAAAKKQLLEMTPEGQHAKIHLSLSDDLPMAQAFVVLEAY